MSAWKETVGPHKEYIRTLGSARGCLVKGCNGSWCEESSIFTEADSEYAEYHGHAGIWHLNPSCVQVRISRWINRPRSWGKTRERAEMIESLKAGVCLLCQKRHKGVVVCDRCSAYRDRLYRKHLPFLMTRLAYSECPDCGIKIRIHPKEEGDEKAVVDHIVPFEGGGAVMDIRNLRATCGRCNSAKRDRMPDVEILGHPGHLYPAYDPSSRRDYRE